MVDEERLSCLQRGALVGACFKAKRILTKPCYPDRKVPMSHITSRRYAQNCRRQEQAEED